MACYSLAAGISYCDAGGKYVFLDLAADRYFCLNDEPERAFARLVAGASLTGADRQHLNALEKRGILRTTASDTPVLSSPRLTRAQSSLIDVPMNGSAVEIALAAISLLRAKRSLRRRSLISLITDVQRTKSELPGAKPESSEGILKATAGAFRRTALITGSLDQCLAISLAITHRLLRLGQASDLVFGVKLRPFHAHAWVQSDGYLVSDPLDAVAPFTPILVI